VDGVYVDIMNEKGVLVTKTAEYQISPIAELSMDLDNIINREDQQLQTVGHHWPLDGPLSKEVRENMERQGVCLSCHKEIPEGRFVYQIISKVGDALQMIPATDEAHQKLVGKAMFIAANVQIFGPLLAIILILFFVVVRKKKSS
jgi:hypothetical protein